MRRAPSIHWLVRLGLWLVGVLLGIQVLAIIVGAIIGDWRFSVGAVILSALAYLLVGPKPQQSGHVERTPHDATPTGSQGRKGRWT